MNSTFYQTLVCHVNQALHVDALFWFVLFWKIRNDEIKIENASIPKLNLLHVFLKLNVNFLDTIALRKVNYFICRQNAHSAVSLEGYWYYYFTASILQNLLLDLDKWVVGNSKKIVSSCTSILLLRKLILFLKKYILDFTVWKYYFFYLHLPN